MKNPMRPFLTVITLFLFAWLWPARGHAQRDSGRLRGSSPALQQAVSAASVKYKIPGLAVAFVKRGEPMDIAVFGLRDASSGAPINRNTVFSAGSLGEPVFAYAVLTLAAEGRLDLGLPLTKYAPLPYIRDMDGLVPSSPTEPIYDPRFDQITALRILNHTSGMPDWARNDHLRLRFTPGQQWSYSNEGYLYLQHVVEQVTRQPQESLLERSVLGPTGMSHTSFVWREAYSADMATGHDASGAAVAAQRYARSAPATTMYTTIEDYARFVTVLLASTPALRTHESVVSLMLSPTVTVDSSFSFLWGLGCGIEKSGDDVYFFHRGSGGGFQSFFMASRKSGTAVVILTNSENGLDAVPDIVAATIGGDHPVLKAPFLSPR